MDKEKSRRKFHKALLKLYHPRSPSPPRHQPPQFIQSPPQLNDKEHLGMVYGSRDLNISPDDDDLRKQSSPSNASDCEPQKLTRAQRKRLRKRKLKEAASIRTKLAGPLLRSAYQDLKDELPEEREFVSGKE